MPYDTAIYLIICTYKYNNNMMLLAIDCPCPHICSIGGYSMTPTSYTHFYSVTKHAVTAVAEAVRQELREAHSRIKVTVSVAFYMYKYKAIITPY